jgi:hypothetical protein
MWRVYDHATLPLAQLNSTCDHEGRTGRQDMSLARFVAKCLLAATRRHHVGWAGLAESMATDGRHTTRLACTLNMCSLTISPILASHQSLLKQSRKTKDHAVEMSIRMMLAFRTRAPSACSDALQTQQHMSCFVCLLCFSCHPCSKHRAVCPHAITDTCALLGSPLS